MTTRTDGSKTAKTWVGGTAPGLAVLLAASACVAPRPPTLTPREPKTFTFEIVFAPDPTKPERLCPKSAAVDDRNCVEYANKPDCVRVRRRDTVCFVSKPPSTSFDVYFGPSKPEKAPSGSTCIVIDPDAPRKSYEFSIVSQTCKDTPLDPWIIVEQ